jgi:hypothetical protein
VSGEPPIVVLKRKVYATRNAARVVVAGRPDISPGLSVYLRCDRAAHPKPEELPAGLRALYEDRGIEPSTKLGVEIMTPSFADEILRAWPKAQLVGAIEDVQISFNLALDRVSPGSEGGGRS